MVPSPIVTLPMLILQSETTAVISYVSIFASLVILGYIWYLLFHSNRKEIQLQIPIYPFFQSAGRNVAGKIIYSSNADDTSSLYASLINIDQLTSIEFEEMVVETFLSNGWTNIENISSVNEKGWDITGFDESKLLTYVKVKYTSHTVECSIAQDFHIAKLTGKAQRAIIVTNSEFTDQAIEYAREVNIELMNGQKFREMCQQCVDGSSQSDKLTRPINKASLELEFHEFIDRSMFSYPNLPSTFISGISSSKITFVPYQFYRFNLWQQFANSTRSWVWDMNYPDHLLVNHPIQKWHIVENRQQSESMELNRLIEIIEREGFRYSINPAPKINKLSTVKEIIQQTSATEKSYKDLNNQHINKICTVDASNINIQTSTIFWGSFVDMKAKIGDDTEIELQLHEGKVSKVLNQNKFEDLLDKSTIVCQECQKISSPAKYFRNLDYCLACGKILCANCGHTEVKMVAIKTHWCFECWSQIKKGEKEKKKNKEAIKKLKKSFKEWQIC